MARVTATDGAPARSAPETVENMRKAARGNRGECASGSTPTLPPKQLSTGAPRASQRISERQRHLPVCSSPRTSQSTRAVSLPPEQDDRRPPRIAANRGSRVIRSAGQVSISDRLKLEVCQPGPPSLDATAPCDLGQHGETSVSMAGPGVDGQAEQPETAGRIVRSGCGSTSRAWSATLLPDREVTDSTQPRRLHDRDRDEIGGY